MERSLAEIRSDPRVQRMRTDAIVRRYVAVLEGKCAKTPGGLLGPACTHLQGHEGRCSWGPFFEPNGDFHMVDPHGEWPRGREGCIV